MDSGAVLGSWGGGPAQDRGRRACRHPTRHHHAARASASTRISIALARGDRGREELAGEALDLDHARRRCAAGRGGTARASDARTPARARRPRRTSSAPSPTFERPPSPAVLLRGVLRVVDEHVGALRERPQRRVDAGVVLGVGRVDDAAPVVVDAVREHAARVVELRRPARGRRPPQNVSPGRASRTAICRAELVRGARGSSARSSACASTSRSPRARRALPTIGSFVRRQVRRHEERQALDVVPVQVRQEHRRVDRPLAGSRASPSLRTPGPRVEDEPRRYRTEPRRSLCCRPPRRSPAQAKRCSQRTPQNLISIVRCEASSAALTLRAACQDAGP